MRYLPNIITGARGIAGFLLLVFPPLSVPFWTIYLLCGAGDVLDGWLARRLHAQSRIGAMLDSAADLAFVLCAGVRLLPLAAACLDRRMLWLAGGIAAVKLLAYVVGWIRYRRFAALHTILNKLTGIILFLLPLFLRSGGFPALCVAAEAAALAAAAEELLIQLKAKSFSADIKGIWCITK
ncbi:MAG: CDP-alcohol phosphatidyltransferase family protein [Hominenteromicrobium sp.]